MRWSIRLPIALTVLVVFLTNCRGSGNEARWELQPREAEQTSSSSSSDDGQPSSPQRIRDEENVSSLSRYDPHALFLNLSPPGNVPFGGQVVLGQQYNIDDAATQMMGTHIGSSSRSRLSERSSNSGRRFSNLALDQGRREHRSHRETGRQRVPLESIDPQVQRDFATMWRHCRLNFHMDPREVAICIADFTLRYGHTDEVVTLSTLQALEGYEEDAQLEEYLLWAAQCQRAINHYSREGTRIRSARHALELFETRGRQIAAEARERMQNLHEMFDSFDGDHGDGNDDEV